jgi:3-hydroxyisobutyrate dehydrogenase-like beta-hydroxyacid dehydrogenase
MPRKSKKKDPSVFISHSSVNLEDAKQVEAALNARGFDVWFDDSDMRVGALLGKEL